MTGFDEGRSLKYAGYKREDDEDCSLKHTELKREDEDVGSHAFLSTMR